MSDHVLEYDWKNDEDCDIYFDDLFIINMNHDEHGWSGMEVIGNALDTIARAAGFEVKTKGEPGV